MAVDTKVPMGKPGVAEFKSETFGNMDEPRFGEGVPHTTNITVTASGADISFDLYSVLNAAGNALADYAATRDAGCANYITAQPVSILDGETATFAVYREGHWSMDALVWDEATYDTDAKKAAAFEGSVSPTIYVSKRKYNSDQIL